jgi:hypothetical protein
MLDESDWLEGRGPAVERLFSKKQIALVEPTTKRAEELTGDFFRLPSFGPERYLYEVVTAYQQSRSERAPGVFAHLVRYSRTLPGPSQERKPANFYRICLQDSDILESLRRPGVGFDLATLLLYILTHELVHLVRIERFEHFYDAEDPQRRQEEMVVHDLTHQILQRVSDPKVQAVLECYADHCIPVRR